MDKRQPQKLTQSNDHPRLIMQRLSVFDMLKIGLGPSSSHAIGPWLAAQRFFGELLPADRPAVSRVGVDLYGSLAKTGKGHGTHMAVQLGLCGEDPQTIAAETIDERLREISASKRIELFGFHEVPFDPESDIKSHANEQLPKHPNGMRFSAQLKDGTVRDAIFYSVGGGFVVGEHDAQVGSEPPLPYPIATASDLLAHCRAGSCRISEIVFRNELSWRSESEIREQLTLIKETMIDSIYRGCHTEGVLPGGLNVQRRAAGIARKLLGNACPQKIEQWTAAIKSQSHSFRRVLDWVSCFALAVNEENAAFGRIVTAPTNGAAGVIPAVMFYFLQFCDVPEDAYLNFLLTAGEIGCIFKKGATISAALGGCQAEIGVSSAMAAAALNEGLGGSPEQAAEAAEIAMEHHLGLTCDPVGGLVQIPCIEQSSRFARRRDPGHVGNRPGYEREVQGNVGRWTGRADLGQCQ